MPPVDGENKHVLQPVPTVAAVPVEDIYAGIAGELICTYFADQHIVALGQASAE
jgi:hypothetical protein